MHFLDARRLTGPSLLLESHGSILDVACSAEEAERLVPVWQANVGRMLAELGWDDVEFATATLSGGVSLAFTAPVDALYAASAINEWAWAASDHELNAADAPEFAAALEQIRAAIAEEANPALVQLEKEAAAHGVTMLWDDDEVSLGLGRYSQTWPVRELPSWRSLDWGRFRDVPTALVTGTNGKTTTVRLAAHILRAAGHRVGMSSTDYIAVNSQVVDRDDWSGPGGARNVLRHKEVDAAILETAATIRSGIAQISGLRVLGDPLWVIAFASDEINIYEVMARMAQRGWSLNGLHHPAAVHIAVTLRHTQPGVTDSFLADLRQAVDETRAGGGEPQTGAAPIYGMAATFPARRAVGELLRRFIDKLYTVDDSDDR